MHGDTLPSGTCCRQATTHPCPGDQPGRQPAPPPAPEPARPRTAAASAEAAKGRRVDEEDGQHEDGAWQCRGWLGGWECRAGREAQSCCSHGRTSPHYQHTPTDLPRLCCFHVAAEAGGEVVASHKHALQACHRSRRGATSSGAALAAGPAHHARHALLLAAKHAVRTQQAGQQAAPPDGADGAAGRGGGAEYGCGFGGRRLQAYVRMCCRSSREAQASAWRHAV